ncbi:MBL fold metallo-hydrolase [Oceanispirochaeta crateris]|uniref:MBL fold metallo-hydrolase n=1 Tax=Oceanispirochaeta crateris TaxID=2518645 RepID=A0A5C1QIY5_9SPIO|nr:MBL fold metallo-hydrolase [Oceanispirochaeta crateris]QEN07258.1 MBL fold metallo-hydrolase [Oceanispirochaeta crateris]
MDIEILPAGPIQTNAYLIINKSTQEVIAVDAGPDAFEMIQGELAKNQWQLKALLITHPHWDHILDVYKFVEAGIPVYSHKTAVSEIEHPDSQKAMAIPGLKFIPGKVDTVLSHDETLNLCGFRIEVRDTPGHCPGSLIFYFPDGGCCFTGDVIFDSSVGRTDLPGGDGEALKRSILNQVYTLPDETILYPGHGSSTLVGKEKISNPFITA